MNNKIDNILVCSLTKISVFFFAM